MNLREQYAAAQKAAKDIHDKATAEGRPKSDEERADFDKHLAEAKRLKEMLDQIDADEAAMADLEAGARITAQLGKVELVDGPRRTPGDLVVDSDQFKAMLAAFPDGVIPKGTQPPVMGAVRVGGFNALLTDPELYTVPKKLAPAALEVIDLFQALNVIEDAPKVVEIDRETFDNQAGIYVEGSEGDKPESSIVYTPDEVTLATIAHWIPVTTQSLKYNSILRSRINTRLVNGVLAKAQAEVAATLRNSGALMQNQGFDTSLAVTLRKAVTKAMRGINAIGASSVIRILIAPEDHETLDLEMLDAMVALAGQELSQTARIWRAEILPLFGLPKGICFVGDSKQVDFYIGPDGVTVSTGWIDKQFVKNRLTFLAEMDAKAAVIGGAALVRTDLDGDAEPNFS